MANVKELELNQFSATPPFDGEIQCGVSLPPTTLELTAIESSLNQITYTYERSTLDQVTSNFPRLEGLNLIDWIKLNPRRKKILEIGGGKEQAAARELLSRFPEVSLYALEPRLLTDEAKTALEENPAYHLIDQGISRMDQALAGQRFDIIFAHHVLEHLPNPLEAMGKVCDLIEPGGVFFCNTIPLVMGTPQRLARMLRRRGAVVEFEDAGFRTESHLLKAGIIRTDFAIKVGYPFSFPRIKEIGPLIDFHGQRLRVRECLPVEDEAVVEVSFL